MRNNDPLASLNIAPTAAQLEYGKTAAERNKTFLGNAWRAFKHAYVGDDYSDPMGAMLPASMLYGGPKAPVPGLDLTQRLQELLDGGSDPEPTFSGSGKVQAKPITYSDWSDAAKYFGMDQATAYAEHMANTAHQREVADLRAAGLNPVLGLGSGASGVTGHTAASGGGSSSSAKKTDDGTLVDVIGATVGFLASLVFGASAGNHASKAVSGFGRLFGDK